MMQTPDDEQKQLNQMDGETLNAIERKAERKAHYRGRRKNTLWFGLGTMGLVGWSIAVPTVLGIFAGLYLEENSEASFSWVLTGLVIGLVIGCFNAWYWVSRERESIQRRRKE